MAKRRNRDFPFPLFPLYPIPFCCPTVNFSPVFRAAPATGTAAPGTPLAGWYSIGSFWYLGSPLGTRYNHVMPPNLWSCAEKNSDNDGAHTAASRHPGVVNALFADGSVKSIKGTVNRSIWRALGTKAGGEVVSASDY